MEKDKNQFNVNFSQGKKNRYGADELSTLLVVVGLICMFIFGYYYNMQYLNAVAITLLVYALFRMSSTNISARRGENRKYLEHRNRFVSFFTPNASKSKTSKVDACKKEITCPKCSAHMNVPVGKGSIRVTCPSCNEKFTIES